MLGTSAGRRHAFSSVDAGMSRNGPDECLNEDRVDCRRRLCRTCLWKKWMSSLKSGKRRDEQKAAEWSMASLA